MKAMAIKIKKKWQNLNNYKNVLGTAIFVLENFSCFHSTPENKHTYKEQGFQSIQGHKAS